MRIFWWWLDVEFLPLLFGGIRLISWHLFQLWIIWNRLNFLTRGKWPCCTFTSWWLAARLRSHSSRASSPRKVMSMWHITSLPFHSIVAPPHIISLSHGEHGLLLPSRLYSHVFVECAFFEPTCQSVAGAACCVDAFFGSIFAGDGGGLRKAARGQASAFAVTDQYGFPNPSRGTHRGSTKIADY